MPRGLIKAKKVSAKSLSPGDELSVANSKSSSPGDELLVVNFLSHLFLVDFLRANYLSYVLAYCCWFSTGLAR